MGIASLETSRDMELNGIPVDLDGDVIWIRRAGNYNTDFEKALEEVTRPYRSQIDNHELSDEDVRLIKCRVYARAVIADWKLYDEDTGEELDIPCTEENAYNLLAKFNTAYAYIREAANMAANFRSEAEREDIKKYKKQLGTT